MQTQIKIDLIKTEIKSILDDLIDAGDFYKLAYEPLLVIGRAFSENQGSTQFISILPLLVCEAISNRNDPAVPIAAIMQLLMAAGDVFDDVEDADSAESISNKYGAAISTNLATALVLLAEKGISRLSLRGVSPQTTIQILDSINLYYLRACVGQHLDLASNLASISEEEYLNTISLKSAAQIECACHNSALVAGANQTLIDIFSKFGHNLGMAAQIANDIRGLTTGKDLLKRKITLPIIFSLRNSESEIQKQLEGYYLNNLSGSIETKNIQELLIRSGAVHYATVKKELYKQRALEALLQAESNGANVKHIKSFLDQNE